MLHVLVQISWLAGALRVMIAALATSRASTQTTFVKFVAASLLVWFAGDMKSERPSKDDEQHCRCVVWEEKTVLQSLDVAFSAPSRKSSFLLRPSFLRRRTSIGFASRRFSRWQSKNQKDSRLDRVRIIISDRTCALLNAQQIKMVSREACVCALWSRTGQGLHVCMRAYLRNLLGSAPRC